MTVINLTAPQKQTICFVAATRMTEQDFWLKSPLGKSLHTVLHRNRITCRVTFKNSRGLPEIYNTAIREEESDILVFLHDDVWLTDSQLAPKIQLALKSNDIIGVAGNTRRVANQPAWLFLQGANGKLEYDGPYLSGLVLHGTPENCTPSHFGPQPAKCELMDGVFLAAKRKCLLSSNVYFDETFKFHFYDMDFCRTARKSGLTLTTWPLELIHQSSGEFGGEAWEAMKENYFDKWKK